MTIFGKRLSEYVEFCKVFIVVVLAVGIVRLALSLAGMPNSTVKWFSTTGVLWIGILYYAIRVHTSGFGSYKHLFPIVALPQFAVQAIAIVAIGISIFTGNDNIYSAPEYAFGSDGKTWGHLLAHLFIGTTVGSLVGWLGGCLFMFISKSAKGVNHERNHHVSEL